MATRDLSHPDLSHPDPRTLRGILGRFGDALVRDFTLSQEEGLDFASPNFRDLTYRCAFFCA